MNRPLKPGKIKQPKSDIWFARISLQQRHLAQRGEVARSAAPLLTQKLQQRADLAAVLAYHRRELIALGVGHADTFDRDVGNLVDLAAARHSPIDANRRGRVGEKRAADNRHALGLLGAGGADRVLHGEFLAGIFGEPVGPGVDDATLEQGQILVAVDL